MAARIVHVTSDTYPRVVPVPTDPDSLDVLLPFRIETDETHVPILSWRLDVDVDGRSWSSRVRMRRIREGFADWMRGQMQRLGQFQFEHLPYYVGLDDAIRTGRTQYLEARLPAVRAGASVRYTLEVELGGGEEVRSGTFSTWAVAPTFEHDHVRRIHIPTPGRALDAWVLYHRRTDERDEIRVDVVDLLAEPHDGAPRPDRPDLVLEVGQRVVDLRTPDPGLVPLVDLGADSVTFAVPREGDTLPRVAVTHRGTRVPVDLAERVGVGRARVMFVNFAIQGLNDLFADADDDYTPPRTYTQVTMRDPAASYSSRPGSKERITGDGYGFTIDAHRRYGLPQMWAMNAGLLDLLAHDCPDELEAMREDVRRGLLVPVVAGFGAHRLPYYSAATNIDAITFGSKAMEAILGATRPVYYPDSRITTDQPNVVDALKHAGVEYIVVDAARPDAHAGRTTVVHDPQPPLGQMSGDRWIDWPYLWRDRTSGVKLLFIDPEMKDKLLGADNVETDRGKVARDLRRKFIELAAQPDLRRDNLLVYSDDADKASGNGWFDGVYTGDVELPFNQRYQAALSWLAAHPWVQVVTTDDLSDRDCVGELDLVRASDPYIESLNVSPVPGQDWGLAFDTWFTTWSRVRAAWLGETLGEISSRAERAIGGWPAEYRNPLFDLARLYFTLNLHESQWSKRARIPQAGDPGASDPENFVVAESLQLRNTHVYLNAAVWAAWATDQHRAPAAHRDGGPVVERVAQLEQDLHGGTSPAWRRPDAAGLQWDHDPLANVLLYTEQALVVLDRNGGRITHLFSIVDGRPCSLSGTFKAYQFLEVDWPSDSARECDGIVLQNTVRTPNHAYVACDVEAALGTTGASPPGDHAVDWCYPDNFNFYDEVDGPAAVGGAPAVTFEYGDSARVQHAPDSLPELEARLDEDRAAKLAGDRGVVVHDVGAFGRFRKTVRLEGRTVHVTYRDTRPGHRVANEFCVDLWASAMDGQRQTHTVASDGASAEVSNGTLAVRVELGGNCEFSSATRAPLDPPTVASLRVHRVMTDDLEIVCPAGGDFDYRIVLP
jgi:hypothetical protein